MAMLPGMIAKERKHPWAQAVTVAGWVTLLFGFVLWPCGASVGVRRCPQPKAGEITR